MNISIRKVANAVEFFSDKSKLEEAVLAVRNSFGREDMDFGDIYSHLTSPETLLLFQNESQRILGIASYNNDVLSGIPALIVEGIALDPQIQANGIFKKATDFVLGKNGIVCLRTQSSHMYRALAGYCTQVYPGQANMPKAIEAIHEDLANKLGCNADGNGVVKGFYGGLMYGKKPFHPETNYFLEQKLGMNIEKGDALLVVGIK